MSTQSTDIQIEAGKRYVRRDGGISGVIKPSNYPPFNWEDGNLTYTDSGHYFDGEEYDFDLVEEYVEPETEAPADDTDEVGYRILEPGELVQKGDEVRDDKNGQWFKSNNHRCQPPTQCENLKYRRPLKTDEAKELTAADVESDGWIEWSGGECPVNGGARVEILTKSGGSDTGTAICYLWQHYGNSEDIVAYREVPADQPADQPAEPEKEPQPDEWWEVMGAVVQFVGETIGGRYLWKRKDGRFYDTDRIPIRHLPNRTGFETPEETRLRELEIEYQREDGEEYYSIDPLFALLSRDWEPDELEAIAAHMRSVKGGGLDAPTS